MDDLTITYIGHATCLIQSGEHAILTDPNFGSRVLTQKRLSELTYDPAGLPKLSAILISHTHLDHLNLASLKYIKTTIPIVVPEGCVGAIGPFAPNPIIELSTWATHVFDEGLKVHAAPADHPGGRFCPCRFKKVNGYIIELPETTIYFAGDTGYNKHFIDIGKTYSIDAALLPVGSYSPAFFMRRFHMDPTEAVQAFLDLRAQVMIPIHWGTFRLSLEKPNAPIERLKKISEERELTEQIKILEHGGTLHI